MKSFTVLSAIVATVSAQGYFGVMSARSGSAVHLLPLTARGLKFYLGGGAPATYCPPNIGAECDSFPVNSTILAGGTGTLGMGVVVPGGQQVYIAPDGTMSYTVPHSAAVPEGAVLDGWSTETVDGKEFGELVFDKGLVACPTEGNGNRYQVFGAIDGVEFGTGCLGFDALSVNSTGPGAWEYI